MFKINCEKGCQTPVLVDGPFKEEKKDITLAFRGSRNQRLIDMKKSLKEQEVIELEV